MTAELWATLLVPVVTILVVGTVILWAVRRGQGGTSTDQLQKLQEQLDALGTEKLSIEKRLLVEEEKIKQLQKLQGDLVSKEADLAAIRDQREAALRDADKKEEIVRSLAASVTELRERLASAEKTADAAASKLTDTLAEVARLTEELKASTNIVGERGQSLEALKVQLESAGAQHASIQEALSMLRVEYASLQQMVQSEREQTAEKLTLLNNAREQLTSEFKLLSNNIFKQHSEELANQNKEQLSGLLTPMRDKLNEFQQGLQVAHIEAAKEQATLKEQIRMLSEASTRMTDETTNLTRALKGDSQTQGAWGEMILENILERSGLREGHEYRVQESTVSEEGNRLRPDVIVDLPNNQHIVIDSKVSLTAFEEAVNADSAELRAAAMSRHLTSMKSHIKLLSAKDYTAATGSELGYVILFVPVEGALAAALELDPNLTLASVDSNVAITTPTTLMMALRTVASLWQVERRNRNAEEIAIRAGRLYDKFVGFVDDLAGIGTSLDNTKKNFDNAMSKLATGRGNLLNQVETMKKLGAKAKRTISAELLDQAESEDIDETTVQPLEAPAGSLASDGAVSPE